MENSTESEKEIIQRSNTTKPSATKPSTSTPQPAPKPAPAPKPVSKPTPQPVQQPTPQNDLSKNEQIPNMGDMSTVPESDGETAPVSNEFADQ